MEILAEMHDSDVGSRTKDPPRYSTRRAARAVLFDSNGRVCLMHAAGGGYFKLPGGGIERNESVEEALRREVLEEAGCRISRIRPIGSIIEYRNRFKIKQTSYCFAAKLVGTPGQNRLERGERLLGFKPVWVKLDRAITLIKKSDTSAYGAKFMTRRDLIFLQNTKKAVARAADDGSA